MNFFPTEQIMTKNEIKFKTRTLPLFGKQVNENEINFKWTIQEDYERLQLDKIVKLSEVRLAKGKVSSLASI